MNSLLFKVIGVFFALFFSAMTGSVFAQSWPTRAVTFVSPFPPGGSVDPIARLLAAKLTEALGQQFIVENRVGASGSIGTGYVAKSAPDGYTFLMGTVGTHGINKSLYSKMPFDPQKDFAQISAIAESPSIMIARADGPQGLGGAGTE